MRKVLLVVVMAAAGASARAAQESVSAGRAYGSWRSLVYQLPGAYRFVDRLDLTDEQQTALDKVYRDWAAQRRELLTEALATLPPLSAQDRKDPQKVKAYYSRRAEVYKAAQIPPPLALVSDILSDKQIEKIVEAAKVVDAWTRWLADHMQTYDDKLSGLLGPAPEPKPRRRRFTYAATGRLIPGGSLLGRLKLTPAQTERLDALRKRHYTEYRAMLAPLTHSLRGGEISYPRAAAVRRAVGSRVREEAAKQYRERASDVLTESQRKLLAKAVPIVEERDRAIWERYARYVTELSAILPPTGNAATARGGKAGAQEKGDKGK